MNGGGCRWPKRSTTIVKPLRQGTSGIKEIIEDTPQLLKAEIAALLKQDTINSTLENFARTLKRGLMHWLTKSSLSLLLLLLLLLSLSIY